MSCLVPGRVVVAPKKSDLDRTVVMLSERAGKTIKVAYSMSDVLSHCELKDEVAELEKRLGPLPFVVRVPEGEELELALQFSQTPGVKCSFPDFLVRPAGADLAINAKAMEDALDVAGLLPATREAGASTKVAILDTGVDPRWLANECDLDPKQYDAQSPRFDRAADIPSDALGHGTLIAHIINRICPATALLSVKTMTERGTIGSLLAGVYLAEAAFSPDIFNLSLSFSCEDEYCSVCGSPQNSTVSAAQVALLFQSLEDGRAGTGECPLFVAAAANNRTYVSMPASFQRFIAVGAYDATTRREADYSRHNAVPKDRYVLAPGGGQGSETALGRRARYPWGDRPELFGTSFAAAFVTGTIARYLGELADLRRMQRRDDNLDIADRYRFVVDCLAESCDTSWVGYDARRHGLGLLRWETGVANSVLRRSGMGAV